MDGADTVDVSWLHHSQKDNLGRTRSTSSGAGNKQEPTPSKPTNGATTPHTSSESSGKSNGAPPAADTAPTPVRRDSKQGKGAPETAAGKEPGTSTSTAATSANTSKPINTKSSASGRRSSWISSLSSKFSSGSTPPSGSPLKDLAGISKQTPQSGRPELTNPFAAAAASSSKDGDKKDELPNATASPPQKTGHPSFLHNALRRFSSSNSPSSGPGKTTPQRGTGPRKVMNVDQARDRCKVPELDPSKLRRVSFCVDVEIAGTSRQSESAEEEAVNTMASRKKQSSSRDQSKRNKKSSDSKPDAKSPQSDKTDSARAKTDPQPTTSSAEAQTSNSAPATTSNADAAEEDNKEEKSTCQDKEGKEGKEPSRKQEKKKRSEEERKERKEKKRRLAEESGSIPLQINLADKDGGDPVESNSKGSRSHKNQDQPTTDPVRIYRRCCQLRETGVLKKLVEQISSPSSVLAESPGTVAVLDLTDFWMTLQDITTFSDWLAIVPVRKLILNNCGLTDEAIRVILGGLLSTKTIEAARYARGLSKENSGTIPRDERYGAIEKLSLKGNPKIGPEGWRHIALFIHMSRSLKGIDVSSVPFPRPGPPTNSPTLVNKPPANPDVVPVLAKALAERFAGNRLEELVLNECYPTAEGLAKICSAVTTLGLRRFGIANDDITEEGLEHVLAYLSAGCCEGLDLGGNDLEEHLGRLATAVEKAKSLTALSLADCSLTPKGLPGLLQNLTTLPSFRFIDLSHNQGLFATQPDSLATLRRYLPKLPELKRIHLADVNLSSEHAIALAEILPDCPRLCHINVLENPEIEALATSKDPEMQEEACALYASLTAAARVSHTLIAIDIDVPAADNNEVVKALASQIVAYSLHNLERAELVQEFSSSLNGAASGTHEVPMPEILAHIVGHSGDIDETVDDEEKLAPDEDYVISGTGVVKALGICLGNAESAVEPSSGSATPTGATTPVRRLSQPAVAKKPRDMSKNLLESARKIRVRLRPALIREDRAGNDLNYRRLQFLDGTLDKMIQRFESEFPDTRVSTDTAPVADNDTSANDGLPNDKTSTAEASAAATPALGHSVEADTGLDDEGDQYAVRLSRTSSNTSLHSRALTSEEGRVHRLSQHLRRDILDSELEDQEGRASRSAEEDADVAALRAKLERLQGSEMQSRIETVGADKALEEVGSNLEELVALQKQDPEAFAEFKESQIAALINAGLQKEQDLGAKEQSA